MEEGSLFWSYESRSVLLCVLLVLICANAAQAQGETRQKDKGNILHSNELRNPQSGLEIYKILSHPEYTVVCRIHRVCRSPQGEVFIPSKPNDSSRRNLADIISSYCGQRVVAESHDRSLYTEQEMDAREWAIGGLAESQATLRTHMPHFLSDFFPVLAAWELLRAGSPPVEAFDSRGIPLVGNHRTASKRPDRGVVIMQDGYSSENGSHNWVGKLLQLVPLDSIANSSMRSDRAYCFKSAIVAGRPSQLPVVWTRWTSSRRLTRPDFFARNNLKREFVSPKPPPCILKVVVVNRRYRPGLGRDIKNIAALVQGLKRLRRTVGPNRVVVQLDPEVAYLDEKTFQQQQELFQKAEIIVGVHGAELSNLIFGRSGSLLIEVLPFAYDAHIFKAFAHYMGIRRQIITAQPDLESFSECIKSYNSGNPTAADAVIRAFANSAENSKEGAYSSLSLSGKDMIYGIKGQSFCARSQRLDVDLGRAYDLIFDHAGALCR